MRKYMKGFTLIELMIVVVIVAILASVAIPSYTDYVKKARRTEARVALMSISAAMEKFLLLNNAYPADIATLINGAGTQTGVGAQGIVEAGGYFYSEGNNYRLSRNGTDDATRGWRIIATPATTAAKGDTDCYFFNLYQNGEWRVQKNDNSFLAGADLDHCLPN